MIEPLLAVADIANLARSIGIEAPESVREAVEKEKEKSRQEQLEKDAKSLGREDNLER